MDFVVDNLDKPWSWYGLSINPNITFEFVYENPNRPWDWYSLSTYRNMLLSSMDLYGIIKRHSAAKAIQKHWRHNIANPCYMVCRRRLLREFDEIVQ
jgi:hypothetical protein